MYLIAGKWGQDGSWSPRAPSQPPFLPRVQTAAAAHTLQLWPSALLMSTWSLGDSHRDVILATVWRTFSSQDQEAHFSSGSFTISSFRSGLQGHCMQTLMLQATPNPILSCPALPLPIPTTMSLFLPPPYSFLSWVSRTMLGIHWCVFGSLPPNTIASQPGR